MSQHIHGSWGKKRRTREHVIAELGVNFVQRQILLKGHSSNVVTPDYGIDLLMFTHNDDGEIENGHVAFQVKSTDHLVILKTSREVTLKVEVAHLKAWQNEPLPVILVVYDATGDGRAFWLYIRHYVNCHSKNIDLDVDQDTITLRIPIENQLDATAIDRFRGFRDRVLAQVKGVISHDG